MQMDARINPVGLGSPQSIDFPDATFCSQLGAIRLGENKLTCRTPAATM